MFGKAKRLIATYKLWSLVDGIIQEWRQKKPMGEKFYNGFKGTTFIFAAISAAVVFAGNMLGWDAGQIEATSKTLVELCAVVGLGGVGGKVASAIAGKKNGVIGMGTPPTFKAFEEGTNGGGQ